ncbi:MAG: EAL domain-containing protein [Pseudomonadales bacterium]|nr:EAL domain-containing protein [Pseudomonadales bacterium]
MIRALHSTSSRVYVVLFALIYLSLLWNLATAQENNTTRSILSDTQTKLELTNLLRLFETPANIEPAVKAPIQTIINEATLRRQYKISDADTDYWFYGEFSTDDSFSTSEGVIVLDHPYPLYDSVTLIVNPTSANPIIHENGNAYAIDNRPIKSRLMAFKIKLAPQQHYHFLLKVHSLAKQPFSLSVQTTTQFLASVSRIEFLWGLFFGTFFIAALYNLLIYTATQEKLYLYYVFFIISTGLAQAGVTSHGITFIWPFASEWNVGTNLFFIGIAGIFGIIFTQAFLNTKDTSPLIHQLFNLSHIPFVAVIIMSQLLRYDTATTITDITLAWLLILILSAGFNSYRSGEKTARFFLLGWGSLLTCMMIYIAMMRGFIPTNNFTLFAPQIGSLLEIFILTLAIGERIKQDRKDKMDAIALQKATIGKLQTAEEALTEQATHDHITGLGNQTMLIHAIDKILVKAEHSEFYLVLVKIKNLREINNTLGRFVGDEVAKFMGEHLNQGIQQIPGQFRVKLTDDHEYLAVTQGVTFAFIVQAPNNESVTNLVTNTLRLLPQQFRMESISLDIDTYAGICSASQSNYHNDTWLRNAFVAIEQALQFSQTCQFYDEEYNPYSQRRLALINALKLAVENDELEIYLQPQLETDSKTIVSAEALLRWIHPQHGFVPPDEFIQLAEDSGVIKPLTRWVIKNSLMALQQLHQQGYLIRLSINISPQNIEEEDLTAFIVESLKHYKIAPEYLTFEITETAMLDNPELAARVLNQWHAMRLETAIDDFGTGYSSLSYLKRLPMKEIKIDRSFIKDMLASKEDKNIVTATLAIGHSFGMRVVAEGVEDEALLEQLTTMRCDLIQGYFLSRPLPINEFAQWLKDTPYKIGHPKLYPIGNNPKRSQLKGK